MPKEYLTFVRQYSDLTEGEREIFIKDLTPGPRKYDTRRVRATLRRKALGQDNEDILWVRSETGVLDPEPWAITITAELEPYVAGRPWSDVFSAMKVMKR